MSASFGDSYDLESPGKGFNVKAFVPKTTKLNMHQTILLSSSVFRLKQQSGYLTLPHY